MKDIYYRMKAWFAVRKMEKLEDTYTTDYPLQDAWDNDEDNIDESHNSLE